MMALISLASLASSSFITLYEMLQPNLANDIIAFMEALAGSVSIDAIMHAGDC